MNPKYIRYVDFFALFISLEILYALIMAVVMLLVGPNRDDPVLNTMASLMSLLLFWSKVGLGVLFMKDVPTRSSNPEQFKKGVEYRKLWAMALLWPLMLGNTSRK